MGRVGVAIDLEEMTGLDHYVIKTHGFNEGIRAKADIILSSHRDLRDVVASCHRMFNMPLTIDVAREAMGHYISWVPYAKYDMRYETMIENPTREIGRIASILGLQVDASAIATEIAGLSFVSPSKHGHDKTTFLHPNHITNGKHGSWVGMLPLEVADSIIAEFADWMKENKYY